LRSLALHALESDFVDNAIFLSGRLYALAPAEESLALLATCHARNRDYSRVHHLLQGMSSHVPEV